MSKRCRPESKSRKSFILRVNGVAYAHGECLEELEICARNMLNRDQNWVIVPKGRRKSSYTPHIPSEPTPCVEETWEGDFPELLFG